MEEEEINKQLQTATQFIIDSKEESVNFKVGGQRFKEGAEAYRTINDQTIQEVFEALQKCPEAVVSQEQLNKIEQIAERGAQRGVHNTQCALPSSDQMIPILREAYKKVGPEITYKRVINGKKWFWIGIVLLALSCFQTFLLIKDKNSFDGTAESWANRMYLANVELYEKNPGAGYDEIMKDFANGNAENAKEKVVRKENKLSEIQNHRGKYEKKISEFLAEDFPSGVRIVEFEKTAGQRFDGWLGKRFPTNYNFIYAKVITLDKNSEFRVVMERQAGLPSNLDPWDIYITTDKRINSVADYRKKASVVNWEYFKKKAIK